VFTEVRKAEYPGMASDLDYGKAFGFGTDSKSTKTNPFNILDPSGYMSLPQLHLNTDPSQVHGTCQTLKLFVAMQIDLLNAHWFFIDSFTEMTLWAFLRTIIWMILCAKEDQFWVLMGVVCSSWVSINVGTSKRSVLCPTGDERLQYVIDANCMVSRLPGNWRFWQSRG